MKRAVLYDRVSSLPQVENLSLTTQEDRGREWCARNNVEVVAVFTERGESAKTANRTELKEMLKFCRNKANRIDYVVVYDVKRFARRLADHVALAAQLRAWGIDLRSVTEPIDETHHGQFMGNMLAAYAQFDNDTRSDRALDGLRDALKIGRWCFGAPIGYLPGRDASNAPIVVVDPERGPLIRWGLERFATGLHTQKWVLDELNAQGLLSRKGNKVSLNGFNRTLRNHFYYGWLVVPSWGTREKGKHEPLISQETFDKIQAILTGRYPTTTPHKRNRPDFPLRGYARCATCGAPMTGGWPRGRTKRYPYYSCTKHCRGVNIRAEELHRQYSELLDRVQKRSDQLDLFIKMVKEIWHEQQGRVLQTKEARCRQVKELEVRRQRVLDVFFAQAIDQKTFQEQLGRVDSEIANVRAQAAIEEPDAFELDEVLEVARRIILNPVQMWQDLPLDQKQQLQLVLTGPEIRVSHEGIVGTTVITPCIKMLGDSPDGESPLACQVTASWNQVLIWLRQIDTLRRASIELMEAA